MSSGPMDVSLRVRMRYEAGDGATRATGDLEKVRATAERLGGATAGGERLNQGLRNTSVLAQSVQRDMQRVAATATRLGAADGTARLAGGLKDAGQAAGATNRDLTQLSQVAARFGTLSTVSYLARDLKAVHAPAQAVRTELAAVGKAAEGIGRSRGTADLERGLSSVVRRAEEAQAKLDALGRARDARGRFVGLGGSEPGFASGPAFAPHYSSPSGYRRGSGERGEFANEALRASGLGSAGLRFGMSGAAAGGLAVGAGIAATAGATALATREAISFEHAMTEVGKAIGSTSEGMRDLQAQFLAQSRKTGIRATEIAGIAAQGGYFNVPRDQIQGFTDVSAKAAVGFQMRPEETASAFGPLMKAYKLKDVDELRLAGDAINTVGDSAGVRERNILDYLNRTSGIAGMSRIPLAKNAAIGGAIQSLGVAPDVAATGIGEVFNRLSNANLQGKDFQRGLRGIHMTGRQVKASMDQDAVGGFIDVLERINKLSDTKKPNVIRDMFGEGEVATVSRMAESVGVLREALERVSDPEKYRGSLEKTFKIFSSDTTASINRAGAALEGFATRLGQRFEPAVKASADVVARWLGGMTKAMELADRAKALSEKQLQGKDLTPKEKSELDANPKLKAETDRQVGIGREDAERRAIVEQEGRARARNAPAADPKAASPAVPREPDEQDAAAAQARERARIRLQGQIRDLDAEVEGRQRGGFETTADRLRLRKLRQQYERQFPEGDDGAQAVPGTGKRSDLQEGVKASLASYHEEVDRSLTRTERLAREMGKRIRDDLEIKPKVQDAAFRFGGENGARIERASIGGGSIAGGTGSGGFGGDGSGGGGSRGMPGRFGGSIPTPRGGGGRFGGGSAGGSIAPGRGGHQAPTTAQGKANVASWLAYAQRPVDQGGLGLSKEQAHGMVAGMQGESGINLDPGSYNPNDRGAPSGGTMQWRKERLDALRAFAAERGDTANNGLGSVETQQQYQRHEFLGKGGITGGSERRAYEAMKGETTREGTLKQFVAKGERPQFPGPEIEKRSRYLYGHEGGTADGGAGKVPAGQSGSNGEFDPLGGAARRYTSGFGMRDHPVRGGRRMHYGQDMAAPAGTPVSAMQGGRITAVSRMGDVTVTHADGSTKTYRHIDPSGLKVGQEIEGGAQIGTLRARDPRSTGPHLHLEATDAQGRRYDPRAEINEAGRPNTAVAERGSRDTPTRSPRFMDPSSYSLKPGAGGSDTGAGGASGRFGLDGPKVEQHFHTNADAHEVGRRAQLEQNREVRRTMAGALHDVGQPVSV